MLQVKGEKPPAPTRGLTAGGGDADDDEDEVDADDKDDDKIDDSLPRTDIRYSIFICIKKWVHVPYNILTVSYTHLTLPTICLV